MLREAARGATPVTPVGGGSKARWGHRLDEGHLELCTSGLRPPLRHAWDDLVAVVGAGTPLAELQGELAAAGQRLALDPPDPERRATVGGIVASGDSGPMRHRFGAPRDVVIGMSFLLADGTPSRTGGRVIKNVAGYDLGRLLCGSLGTLAVVTEVVLRLQPLPERTSTLRVPLGAHEAAAAAAALSGAGVEAASVTWADGALLVRLEGREEAVGAHVRDAVRALRSARGKGDGGRAALEAQAVDGAAELGLWSALARRRCGAEGHVVMRCVTRPSKLAPLVSALEASCGRGVQDALVSDVGVGVHDILLSADDIEAGAATALALRARLAELGARLQVRARPAAFDDLVEPLGPPPPATSAMAAIKRALDPDERLSRGRFRPWW